MKDRFQREIDYLRISVTDRCNLRCLYCMPGGINKIDKELIIRDEDIISICEQAVTLGIKKVRITGGEPLVRKNIYDLIQKINNIEGIEEIVITTNGTLLLGNVHKLRSSGVKRVNLSIDSLQQETQKRISNTDTIIDYSALIKELNEHNISPIKINTVLLKNINDHEVINLIKFSEKFNVQLRFIELMPFESDQFNYEDYYISKEDLIETYNFTFVRKVNNVEYYTYNNFEFGFINSISSKFCSECNRIRLTSDGYIKPCLHSNKEIPIKDKVNQKDIIKEAILNKPKQHSLDKEYTTKSKRSMNKIGG